MVYYVSSLSFQVWINMCVFYFYLIYYNVGKSNSNPIQKLWTYIHKRCTLYMYSLIWKINVPFISLLLCQTKMHNQNSKKHCSTIVHILYCIYRSIERRIYFKCYFNFYKCNTLSMTMVRYSEDVWGANKMTQILGSNSRITSDLISICKQIAK